ncbi:MAG: sensor histidine kinase [Oscillospiraceae bacterium]
MRAVAKKLFKNLKALRVQLFLAYFVTLCTFSVIVLSVMLMVVQNLIIAQIGTSRLDVLRQIAERANTIKTSSITISSLYRYDKQIQKLINEKGGAKDGKTYLDDVKAKYDSVFKDVGLPYEMVIISDDFKYCSKGDDYNFDLLTKQLWFRRLYADLVAADDGEVQYSRTFKNNTGTSDGEYSFSAGCLLNNNDGEYAILLLIIDEQRLAELYSSASRKDSDIYLFDKDGFIISHSNKQMLGKQFIDVENMQHLYGTDSYSKTKKLGVDYLLSTYLDEQTGWTIVEEIPTKDIFGVLYSAYKIIGITLAVSLLAAVLVSIYMSRRISRPLVNLSIAMDSFGSIDFEKVNEQTGTQEIDHLSESFNHMAGEIFALMNDARERSRQKRVLELKFLRAQINPHLLSNTLFSIRCMVEINKNEQAAEMISAFTDLLKKTLSVESSAIHLDEEIESTRKYLVLQKIRYGDKVNFEFDIANEANSCFVPPLILQPIVENAIFHGLEAKKSADMIVITASIENGDLIITICDDGAGMDFAQLNKVRDGLMHEHNDSGHSIGMSNVHSRIRINDGDSYGLELDSTKDIGTTVTLRLKARYNALSSEVM